MNKNKLKIIIEVLSVFYLFGMMVCYWQIDLSLGALVTNDRLTNGWQVFDPMHIYHIALFISIAITILYLLMVILVFNKIQKPVVN